jgi:hypothetical protein
MFVQLRPLQDLRYQSAASGYQLDDAAGWRRAQVRADLDLPTMLEITHHCLEVPFSWSTDQAYICILSSNQHAMHWDQAFNANSYIQDAHCGLLCIWLSTMPS